MLTFTRFVILPHNRELIHELNAPGEFSVDRLRTLYRSDYPDRVIVIWRETPALASLQSA